MAIQSAFWKKRRARHQPDPGEAPAASVVLRDGDEVGLAPAVAVEADVVRFPARIDVDEPALLRGHLEERLEELLAGGPILAPELELPAAAGAAGRAVAPGAAQGVERLGDHDASRSGVL